MNDQLAGWLAFLFLIGFTGWSALLFFIGVAGLGAVRLLLVCFCDRVLVSLFVATHFGHSLDE